MWLAGRGELPGQLVVVSGPSGCGKSTVIRRALERPELKNLRLSVSATTRLPRPGEQDGVDYYFMGAEEFRANLGNFLEWAEYSNHLYGTPKDPVFEALASGRSVLLEIEVVGARQVREIAPAALFVFVRTPWFRVLEQRLRRRGTEADPVIQQRLLKARQELDQAYWYDVQLINDDLDRCVEDLVSALRSNGCGG
jgi:guanylate kinase